MTGTKQNNYEDVLVVLKNKRKLGAALKGETIKDIEKIQETVLEVTQAKIDELQKAESLKAEQREAATKAIEALRNQNIPPELIKEVIGNL